MRILHLDTGREMRGGQWQVLRLHEGLLAEGVGSMLLAREESPLFQAACAKGLPVEGLSLRKAVSWAYRSDVTHAHDARSHTLEAIIRSGTLVVSRRVLSQFSWT